MSAFQNRRSAYKRPPGAVLDKSQTQASRRAQALEEQKRRRAQRLESERHIDLLADLNLGLSDDEDADEREEPEIIREGIGNLAAFIQASSSSSAPAPASAPPDADRQPHTKRKPRRKKGGKHANPWADQCMYAELLEMSSDASRMSIDGSDEDPLPPDLEHAWVAVAPVPAGKRCLAVCMQGSGPVGVVPNTTLRSRALGKPLMPRFPSPLPSDTVLDCILDERWQETGVLHVLDVLKWKGQDVADCETTFRFWWRDTRLSELPPPRPAPAPAPSKEGLRHFAYPSSFLPISYHGNTSYTALLNEVIPRARASYTIPVTLPPNEADAMDTGELVRSSAQIRSDGLLLYVAGAIYEPGTSPLSLWVPAVAWRPPAPTEQMQEDAAAPMDVFEQLVRMKAEGLSR